MRALPWGDTTTYGELAKQLGSTDWEGARDVGEAMGRNPVPVVIPCHRVLAAGGKLGGFSAHGGPDQSEAARARRRAPLTRWQRAAPAGAVTDLLLI